MLRHDVVSSASTIYAGNVFNMLAASSSSSSSIVLVEICAAQLWRAIVVDARGAVLNELPRGMYARASFILSLVSCCMFFIVCRPSDIASGLFLLQVGKRIICFVVRPVFLLLPPVTLRIIYARRDRRQF